MENDQLQRILGESGLDKSRAQNILENFQETFATVAEWERQADQIIVNDENDTEAMELAGKGAKILLKIRTGIEAKRVEMKAPALNETRIIDGLAKTLTGLVIPVEENLKRKWKYIELKQEAAALARRKEADKLLNEKLLVEAQERQREEEAMRTENARLKEEAVKREREIAEENRKKNALILAERQKTADAEDKARKEREVADSKQKTLEVALREAQRAAEVTCPFCGAKFTPEIK